MIMSALMVDHTRKLKTARAAYIVLKYDADRKLIGIGAVRSNEVKAQKWVDENQTSAVTFGIERHYVQ